MAETIRDLVNGIAIELRDKDLPPSSVRSHLMTLSGLLSACVLRTRQTELAYKRVLVQCMKEHGAANKGEMVAQTTEQFEAFREAKDVERMCVEMMRSCKAFLKSLDTEIGLSR